MHPLSGVPADLPASRRTRHRDHVDHGVHLRLERVHLRADVHFLAGEAHHSGRDQPFCHRSKGALARDFRRIDDRQRSALDRHHPLSAANRVRTDRWRRQRLSFAGLSARCLRTAKGPMMSRARVISAIPRSSRPRGRSPSSRAPKMMPSTGVASSVRLATLASVLCKKVNQKSQATTLAGMMVYASAKKRYGLQTKLRAGASSAAAVSANPPKSICQAVSARGSTVDLVNSRRAISVPPAQDNPPSVARPDAWVLPPPPPDKKISASPAHATAAASHCGRDGRSPRAGHASSTTQNGIV